MENFYKLKHFNENSTWKASQLIYRSLFSDSGKLQLFVQVPRFNLDFVLSQSTYQHILKLLPEIQGVLQNMTFNT